MLICSIVVAIGALRAAVPPAAPAIASRRRAAASPVCFETLQKTSGIKGPPSADDSAALAALVPQPALQPREVRPRSAVVARLAPLRNGCRTARAAAAGGR